MINYLKLVHFELTRFRWIYLSLFIVTLLSQVIGLYLHAHDRMKLMNATMIRETLTQVNYLEKYGQISISHYTNNSIWFLGPVFLCITALLLYVFLIWYRDWLGKNMFIYRLMMLPTPRHNIYLAKASTILLSVWGLIAFQLLLLPWLNRLYNSIIPGSYIRFSSTFDIISENPILQILIPSSFVEFLLYYSAGIMGVIVIFTVILMERSFRWKGLFMGILYVAILCIGFLLPWIISDGKLIDYLYPIEILLLVSGLGLLISCLSLWIKKSMSF